MYKPKYQFLGVCFCACPFAFSTCYMLLSSASKVSTCNFKSRYTNSECAAVVFLCVHLLTFSLYSFLPIVMFCCKLSCFSFSLEWKWLRIVSQKMLVLCQWCIWLALQHSGLQSHPKMTWQRKERSLIISKKCFLCRVGVDSRRYTMYLKKERWHTHV